MPALTVCAPELIILVGDQQQLPPFTRASRTEAPLSVLQRMEAVLPAGSIKMLRLQYRMPPQICEFLSAQFYNSSVNTADETRLRCSHLSEPAITWLDHNEHESNHGTSFYNTAEIRMIVDLLNSEPALARDKLAAQQKTAVVITFYSAQVARLQARLQSSRPDVFIMTVDAAQGCEADYVVLSCGLSLSRSHSLSVLVVVSLSLSQSLSALSLCLCRWFFYSFFLSFTFSPRLSRSHSLSLSQCAAIRSIRSATSQTRTASTLPCRAPARGSSLSGLQRPWCVHGAGAGRRITCGMLSKSTWMPSCPSRDGWMWVWERRRRKVHGKSASLDTK